MLFSPRIYSLPHSDYFLSSLSWRGHLIYLYSKLDSPHCASKQHSDLLHSMGNFNYICICMPGPYPRTQPPGRQASHLLHHNTTGVRECVASRRCSTDACSNKDQAESPFLPMSKEQRVDIHLSCASMHTWKEQVKFNQKVVSIPASIYNRLPFLLEDISTTQKTVHSWFPVYKRPKWCHLPENLEIIMLSEISQIHKDKSKYPPIYGT